MISTYLKRLLIFFFSNKRKMINKTIQKILTKDQIKTISNLDLNSRPSDLSPEIYYKITKMLQNY